MGAVNRLDHRGFQAWITSEGQQLPLYEPAIDTTKNRVTCWLASEEGKPFTIHWSDLGSGIDSAAYITLDGFKVPGRFLFGQGETKRTGVRTGQNSERPFVFAPTAPPTAAQRVASGSAHGDPSQLGMICLRVRRVKRVAVHDPNAPIVPPESVTSSRRTDLRVGYGEAMETTKQAPRTWKIKSHDAAHPGSYVTFVFRYRSREWLYDQGVLAETEFRGLFLNGTPAPAPAPTYAPVQTFAPSPALTYARAYTVPAPLPQHQVAASSSMAPPAPLFVKKRARRTASTPAQQPPMAMAMSMSMSDMTSSESSGSQNSSPQDPSAPYALAPLPYAPVVAEEEEDDPDDPVLRRKSSAGGRAHPYARPYNDRHYVRGS
ncbi:hypothetical protein FA95DRAFT_1560425 [Auriscalpium vulgare]|uniref:Uncharacterized protein n=1 Tax=Auriscalpium vulgare TaxID=40419 RepID=A0ACB8RR09_9AGAM|nr:hypothetical protein FA95DRAFT_1560425 [Auriscalpium vulgare]